MAILTLVEAHRRDLRELTRLAGNDLDVAFGAYKTADSARDGLKVILPRIVEVYGQGAGTLAADFYDEVRDTAAVKGSFRAVVAPLPLDVGTDALAGWAVSPLYQAEPDWETAKTLAKGGMTRRIQNVSRDTITTSSLADPNANGWQRTGAGECEYCARLIASGDVHSDTTARFRSHDHCHCSAAPAFVGQPLPVEPTPVTDPKQVKKFKDYIEKGNTKWAEKTLAKTDLNPADRADILEALSQIESEAAANLEAKAAKAAANLEAKAAKAAANLEAKAAKAATQEAKSIALDPQPLNLPAFEEDYVAKIESILVQGGEDSMAQARAIVADPATKELSRQNIMEAIRRVEAAAAKTATKLAEEAAWLEQAAAQRAAGEPLTFRTAREYRTWANKMWDGPKFYTDDELEALRAYTDIGYEAINNKLRRIKSAWGSRSKDRVIRALDSAIERAARVPDDIITVRNTNLDAFGLRAGATTADLQELVGQEFVEHGYMSTSVNRTGAMSGDIRLVINTPKGSKAIYVSQSGGKAGPSVISSFGGGESELIMARGSRLVVKSVERVGGRWKVVCDLVQGV